MKPYSTVSDRCLDFNETQIREEQFILKWMKCYIFDFHSIKMRRSSKIRQKKKLFLYIKHNLFFKHTHPLSRSRELISEKI